MININVQISPKPSLNPFHGVPVLSAYDTLLSKAGGPEWYGCCLLLSSWRCQDRLYFGCWLHCEINLPLRSLTHVMLIHQQQLWSAMGTGLLWACRDSSCLGIATLNVAGLSTRGIKGAGGVPPQQLGSLAWKWHFCSQLSAITSRGTSSNDWEPGRLPCYMSIGRERDWIWVSSPSDNWKLQVPYRSTCQLCLCCHYSVLI